jgi:hypothetical protein
MQINKFSIALTAERFFDSAGDLYGTTEYLIDPIVVGSIVPALARDALLSPMTFFTHCPGTSFTLPAHRMSHKPS